jgi:tartrate-resistant acid phosphatase type 5
MHREEYVYLAGLTHEAALIAWGAFFFKIKDNGAEWKLVDDSDLDKVGARRFESIGRRSSPYGRAVVEVFKDGQKVAEDASSTTNHTWIAGLAPNTEYTYAVTIDNVAWAGGMLLDWEPIKGGGRLVNAGGKYDNRFRTFPHPDERADLAFAVLGDFGTGVRKLSTRDERGKYEHGRQRDVADALAFIVDANWGTSGEVRLILTTGDNIYASKKILGIPVGGQGDEDDDWFFTYFQPYRYVLNRVPVFPSIGNHDTGESEDSDDRGQIEDNLFLRDRFLGLEPSGRASLSPGLFYRVAFGSVAEFIAVDTSKRTLLFGKRYFEHPNHRTFIETAFPDRGGGADRWHIPFGHHPFYCAGPQHGNTKSLIAVMGEKFRRSGVKVYFSGHEHNYQHSVVDGICYVLSGGGGKVRLSKGSDMDFETARTVAWAEENHFLYVIVDGNEMTIVPLGPAGREKMPQPIGLTDRSGNEVDSTITIRLTDQ